MSEVLFKCPCLASNCNDNVIRNWYHSECPSTSHYYLSEEGILRCGNCNETCRLISCLWKSSSCSHESRKTDEQRLFCCISKFYRIENISKSFTRRLLSSLLNEFDELE